MIVMVVRDHHHIDVRQLAQRQTRRMGTRRTRETHRRGTLREDRIGEHVQTVGLHQNTGVPDPGRRRDHVLWIRVASNEAQIGRLARRRHVGVWAAIRRADVETASAAPRPSDLVTEDVIVTKSVRGVMQVGRSAMALS